MRLATAAALLLAACSTAQPPTFSVDVPPELPVFRRATSEMVQYRGPEGELWSFFSITPQFGERTPRDKAVAEKENEHKAIAPRYPSPRIGRRELPGGGTLLTFAYQTTRDRRTYSYVDFATFWDSGRQIRGTVEWPNLLEPWHDAVVNRLATLRPQ